MMNDGSLKEAPLGNQVHIKTHGNPIYNPSLKILEKMFGSLYHFSKYLTPPAVLIYKSQIRPKMKYCCYIWAEEAQSTFSSFDRVHEHLPSLVSDELFSILQSLSYRQTLKNSCYSITISMANILMSYIP